ncbi:hypothetical protein Q3304_08625 [Clostridioides sp. GD02377]|uniref:hypothetical protein n=1 Tax=unclassified Clostridioides TaxID=2635829 RepID=UPI0038A56B3D
MNKFLTLALNILLIILIQNTITNYFFEEMNPLDFYCDKENVKAVVVSSDKYYNTTTHRYRYETILKYKKLEFVLDGRNNYKFYKKYIGKMVNVKILKISDKEFDEITEIFHIGHSKSKALI